MPRGPSKHSKILARPNNFILKPTKKCESSFDQRETEEDDSLVDHMRLLFAPESNLIRSIIGEEGHFDKQDFIDKIL